MAAPFHLETRRLTGDPVRVVEDVMRAAGALNGSINTLAAQYAFSDSGALAYAPGGRHPTVPILPLWVDPSGNATTMGFDAGRYLYPRLSPDGRRLALAEARDIITLELATGNVTRFPMDRGQSRATWSPDGTRLAFTSNHEGSTNSLYWRSAEGGPVVRITTSDSDHDLSDWSSQDVLAFVYRSDIWVVDLEGGEPTPFLENPAAVENWPAFSPDGNWLAYASDERGQFEVHVRPYPGKEPLYDVTRGSGGTRPAWSRDGRRLFYRTGRDDRSKMMAVDVDTTEGFRAGQPRELFEGPYGGTDPVRSYDLADDGRFVMISEPVHPPQPVTKIRLVLNWFEELKRQVPVR